MKYERIPDGGGGGQKNNPGSGIPGLCMIEVAFTNPLGLLLLALKHGFEVLELLAVGSDLLAEHRVPIRIGQI